MAAPIHRRVHLPVALDMRTDRIHGRRGRTAAAARMALAQESASATFQSCCFAGSRRAHRNYADWSLHNKISRERQRAHSWTMVRSLAAAAAACKSSLPRSSALPAPARLSAANVWPLDEPNHASVMLAVH
eukprot:6195975-Pleurochrysis_carterae.AAC.3